jgi:ABC-type glycerol-3-phosphate transport system permease component
LFVFFVAPALYAVLTAFQPPATTSEPTPQWVFTPTLQNFTDLFEQYSFLAPLLNSIESSIIAAIVALVIAIPAAYAMSRSRFSASGPLSIWLLCARALPAIGLAIPAYALFSKVGLNDTITALVLVYLPYNVALATILLRVFFNSISHELDEAATVDGAGRWRILFSIILPLAKPGLASVGILTFVFSWNNFLFPLVLTGSRAGTIPVQLERFLGSETLQWNEVMAAVVLLSLPLLLMAVLMGRYMVRGLTTGGIK